MSPSVSDELAPRPGDPIIDKNRYDAFLDTEPEVVLGALGVKRLVATGVVTNMCVESAVLAGPPNGQQWGRRLDLRPRGARAAWSSVTMVLLTYIIYSWSG